MVEDKRKSDDGKPSGTGTDAGGQAKPRKPRIASVRAGLPPELLNIIRRGQAERPVFRSIEQAKQKQRSSAERRLESMRARAFPSAKIEQLLQQFPALFGDAATGPFAYASLGQIELLLTQQVGTIFWNNYFNLIIGGLGHRRAVYEQYLGAPLPTNATLQSPQRPGSTSIWPPFTLQNIPGLGVEARGVLLAMDTIAYTSRYGGSVQLHFSLVENISVEFAFRSDDSAGLSTGYVIDCSTLEVTAHFVPPQAAFNANNANWRRPASYAVPVVEVTPTVGTMRRWRRSAGGFFAPPQQLTFETMTDAEITAAKTALELEFAKYADILAASLQQLAPFVVGFIHNEHRAQLTTAAEVVDGLAIGDGRFDLWTHTREHYFEIRCRVTDLWVDTEAGGEELEVAMHGHHEFYDQSRDDAQVTFHRDLPAEGPFSDRPHLTLPWYRIGLWPVAEIYSTQGGQRLPNVDDTNQPVNFGDTGQPCMQLRKGGVFLIGVQVRVIEHGPFRDNYLLPNSYPGLWSTLPPDEPIWYGNESPWALREVEVWIRTYDPAAGQSECVAEGAVEIEVRNTPQNSPSYTKVIDSIQTPDILPVYLGMDGTGYYNLVFEMLVHYR